MWPVSRHKEGDVMIALQQSAWGPHNGHYGMRAESSQRGREVGGFGAAFRQKDFMSIFRASKLFIY